MDAVIISIHPMWCYLIAEGLKKIEVRKTRPRLLAPFKCYIYETCAPTETPWMDEDGHMVFKGRGMVIGEFVCDWCDPFAVANQGELAELMIGSRVGLTELRNYAGKKGILYGWHISELKIYDRPKALDEFKVKRPPQSWMYVEEVAA